MNAQPLFLKPEHVPAGVLVYICAPGTKIPETDEGGVLLPPLKLMMGGIPIRHKWYICDPQNPGSLMQGFEYDSVCADTHFIPVETFSMVSAPVRKVYVVYVNNEHLTYDDYPEQFVKIAKTTDGRIVSFNGYAYKHWLREFQLPDDAVLVQTDDFAAERDFALIGCIGIPKPSVEQRTTLEKLGVIFYNYAPFAVVQWTIGGISTGFSFHDYVAVKLPPTWTLQESGWWYYKCSSDIKIYDAKKCQIAHIHQTPLSQSENATWTGTFQLT